MICLNLRRALGKLNLREGGGPENVASASLAPTIGEVRSSLSVLATNVLILGLPYFYNANTCQATEYQM